MSLVTSPYRLIIEEPVYEVKYVLEEQNKDAPSNMYINGPFLMANEANKNKRVYPLEEMVTEVNRYDREMIKQNRALGALNHPNCKTKNANILCENGWKNITEVTENDSVYTLNPETQEIELQKVLTKIDQPYKGKMINIKSRNINTLVTPNHRFPVYSRYNKFNFETAQDIFDNRKKYDHSYIPKTGNWFKDTPEFFTLKGVEKNIGSSGQYNQDITKDINIPYDVFVKFIGIYLAEGCVTNKETESSASGYDVFIYQKKESVKNKIREMLKGFPPEMEWKEGKNKFYLSDKRLHAYLKPLGNCYDKYIPTELKNISAPLLEEMIYWFNLGDGRFSVTDKEKGYVQRNIFSASKKLIEDFQEILLKSGGCGNITIITTKVDYKFADRIIKAENKVPLYQLSLATTKNIWLQPKSVKMEEVDFDDRVYCITVPNQTFYCKENEKCFWTGNSPEIDLKDACHVIKEFKQNGNIFEGRSKILTTPMGQITRSLILDGVKLGVSSRSLGQLTQESNGTNRVTNFRLVAVDVVADPSVPTAFVNGILESKQWVLNDHCEFEPVYDKFENALTRLPKKQRDDYVREQMLAFINKIKELS